MDPSDDHILIRIRSQARHLCVVRAAIEACASRTGFDEEQVTAIMLAVDEALTNVIRHGYDSQDDQPITLRLSPRRIDGREALEMIIEDESDTNPAACRAQPDDPTRPGGLGVSMIHRIMDEVSYERRKDQPGLRLKMVRFLQRTDEDTPEGSAHDVAN